jgi:hypothetical protein
VVGRQARGSFFEKKEPKKFLVLEDVKGPSSAPSSKSFLLLFFKKAVLSFYFLAGPHLAQA